MFSVETVSALGRRMVASIPQQEIGPKVDARLKSIGRTAKIAGFRPGKIPAKILEQYYGDQARRDVLGEAIQRSFSDGARENNLRVAGYPEFEITTADLRAEVIEYSATFEVYPEVTLGDLSAQEVTRSTCELTQADLDKTIGILRKQRVTYEPVERAAQADDRVTIDFVGKLDGEVFKGGEATDYPFVLGAGRMLADFEAAVTGMSVGEEKSFDMTFPEDYHGKDVAGKQVTFTLKLKKLEEPKLPELDSEFAKSIGIEDGDTSKLESEIRSNLQREMDNRLKLRNKESAMDALLSVASFDVPKALVDWEMDSLREQTAQDMAARGMKGISLPPELFRDRAGKRVKLGLVVAELVPKHDLKATAEQIRAIVELQAQSYEQPEEVINYVYGDPARLQDVENLVVEENVVEWVMGQAKVVTKEVSFSELMESK